MQPSAEQRFQQATRSRATLGDLVSVNSNAERALVGEKRRRAACVQEDDILVLRQRPWRIRAIKPASPCPNRPDQSGSASSWPASRIASMVASCGTP